MSSYNYFCTNNGCPNEDRRRSFVVSKDPSQKDEIELCPFCETELKLLGENVSGGYMKINSMTPEQRKVVLKKRSNQDYIKNIKEKKEYTDKHLL